MAVEGHPTAAQMAAASLSVEVAAPQYSSTEDDLFYLIQCLSQAYHHAVQQYAEVRKATAQLEEETQLQNEELLYRLALCQHSGFQSDEFGSMSWGDESLY